MAFLEKAKITKNLRVGTGSLFAAQSGHIIDQTLVILHRPPGLVFPRLFPCGHLGSLTSHFPSPGQGSIPTPAQSRENIALSFSTLSFISFYRDRTTVIRNDFFSFFFSFFFGGGGDQGEKERWGKRRLERFSSPGQSPLVHESPGKACELGFSWVNFVHKNELGCLWKWPIKLGSSLEMIP